jgi:GMP synthase (glutamine-hydrolysing)
MAEVLVLQHDALEPLGTIENALRRAGLRHRYLRCHQGETAPLDIQAFAGLIVLGGSMGVYEEAQYPFLTQELRLIEQALSHSLPTLGVCLGGQLLAAALGASVQPGGQREIGWHPVTFTENAAEDALWRGTRSPFTGFHWHGDFFELPAGATSLAFSARTPCQAFRFRSNVYSFQFHLEVTEAIIQNWTAAFAAELTEAGLEAATILGGMTEHLTPMQQIAQEVFGRWTELAASTV